MRRRYEHLAGLAVTALAFSLACGEATLSVTTPTPTPSGELDCSFQGGAQEVFATRDCGNAGCHLDPGIALLTLVSENMSDTALHQLLMSSGGITQRGGGCGGEWEGCNGDPENPPAGMYCCSRTVRPGQPGASKIILAPLQGSSEGHGGGKQFGGPEDRSYQTLKCWIEAGALGP